MTEKKDFIQLVSEASGLSYAQAKAMMKEAKNTLDINNREFYLNKFYELSPTQQTIRAKIIRNRRKRRNDNFEKIIAATGLSRKEILAAIKAVNDEYHAKLDVALYAKFEVYNYQGDELAEFTDCLKRRRQLRSELLNDFEQIDSGQLTYEDISGKLAEFYKITEKLMPETLKTNRGNRLMLSRPDLADKPDELNRAVVDMEAIIVLLSFSASEYVAFHFWGKTLAEKRTFINDKERMEILKTINSPEVIDTLDHKYHSYEMLHDYYGRELIYVSSGADYTAFCEFCRKHSTIVVKPPCDALGRGVRPVKTGGNINLRELFDSLVAEYGDFIAEELIVAHRKIRKLNPDSVNTIRLVTYPTPDGIVLQVPFMKIGQAGSFVDNGGAGGILVAIDPATGKLCSDGCDEDGVIYENHPQTGVKFKGYQLPKWEQAVQMAKELAGRVPGQNYLGWDLTFTKKRKWVIVEGNAKTQFFGQQCTTDTGIRQLFLDTINYRK